ncbi:hypothetical protein CCHR01_19700 [Colletotrichum chrysophilum]|uniref:Uncharacterized protein n=1 Tax=Colletotrichum chrysophilum TaxID=1836956 RepID=A0AAD9A234_9PEZI|nr:hypothetical protein CCHR01_19700 [Colletotrichum chrysophilum]
MPSLGLVDADTLDIRPPDFGRKNTGCEVREAVESKPKPCTKPSRRSQNATGNKLRNEQGAQAFHCRAKHPMMILEVPQMPTTSEHTSRAYLVLLLPYSTSPFSPCFLCSAVPLIPILPLVLLAARAKRSSIIIIIAPVIGFGP